MDVLCVSGHSGVGKTFLIELLIKEFLSMGINVVAVKHACKPKIDHEGKDSWRLWNAGADTVIISENVSIVMLRRKLSLNEICNIFDANLIIVEGLKKSHYKKIVILDENTDINEFSGEIIITLNKKDVINGNINLKHIVDKIAEKLHL